jgi:hypothetical protein
MAARFKIGRRQGNAHIVAGESKFVVLAEDIACEGGP